MDYFLRARKNKSEATISFEIGVLLSSVRSRAHRFSATLLLLIEIIAFKVRTCYVKTLVRRLISPGPIVAILSPVGVSCITQFFD